MRLATREDIRRKLQQRMDDLGSSRRDVVMRQLAPIGGDWQVVGAPGQPGFHTVPTTIGPPGVVVDYPPDPADAWSSPFYSYGGGYAPPSFRLDTEGFAHMRGVVGWVHLDEPPPVLMFVLPQECRPAASVYFSTAVTHADPANGQLPAQIMIESDGAVSLTTTMPQAAASPTPFYTEVANSGPPDFTPTRVYWTYATILIPLDGLAFSLG